MKCQLEIPGKRKYYVGIAEVWMGWHLFQEYGKEMRWVRSWQDLRVPESNSIRARIGSKKKKGSSQFVVWGGRWTGQFERESGAWFDIKASRRTIGGRVNRFSSSSLFHFLHIHQISLSSSIALEWFRSRKSERMEAKEQQTICNNNNKYLYTHAWYKRRKILGRNEMTLMTLNDEPVKLSSSFSTPRRESSSRYIYDTNRRPSL